MNVNGGFHKILLCFLLDLPEHGDDEVDGGAAGHEGGHRHHQLRVLAVTHRHRHLTVVIHNLILRLLSTSRAVNESS